MLKLYGVVIEYIHIALDFVLVAILLVASAGRILSHSTLQSHISQYGHSVWRIRDGNFGGAPQVLAQTTDGYIWVGTDGGLFKFDGVRFVPWRSPSGEELLSSEIYSLLSARDGSLWIGTGAGLAHLINQRLILYQKNEGWSIEDIYEDRDGKIWFMRIRSDDKTHSLCQVLDARVRCYGSKDGVDIFGTGPIAQDPSRWLISGWEAHSQLLSNGAPEHRKFTGQMRCNPMREISASARYCLRPMALSGWGWRWLPEVQDCSTWWMAP